jgi:hypothetical protein
MSRTDYLGIDSQRKSEDNPSLGCINLTKHHIILKQNFKPLHQRPNRLPRRNLESLSLAFGSDDFIRFSINTIGLVIGA